MWVWAGAGAGAGACLCINYFSLNLQLKNLTHKVSQEPFRGKHVKNWQKMDVSKQAWK